MGLGVVAVNKIEYGTPANPVSEADAAMYRAVALSAVAIALGVGAQFVGGKVAGAGKALGVLGIGVPVAALVAGKVGVAMVPANAAQPLVQSAQEAVATVGFGRIYAGLMTPSPVAPPRAAPPAAAPPAAAPPPATNPTTGLYGWSPAGFASDANTYTPSGELMSSINGSSYISR
jgi:hypothetical protein